MMNSAVMWKAGVAVLSVTLVFSLFVAFDRSETDAVVIKIDQPLKPEPPTDPVSVGAVEEELPLTIVQRLRDILPEGHPAERVVRDLTDPEEIDSKTAYVLGTTLVENGNRDEVYHLLAANSDVFEAFSDELKPEPHRAGPFYDRMIKDLVTRYLQESASDELFENLAEEDNNFRHRLYPVVTLSSGDFEKLFEIEDADERQEIEHEVVRLAYETDPFWGIQTFLNPVVSLGYDE